MAKQVASDNSDDKLNESMKTSINEFLLSLNIPKINGILKKPVNEVIEEFTLRFKKFQTKLKGPDVQPSKRARVENPEVENPFEFDVNPKIPFLEKSTSKKSRAGESENVGKVDTMKDDDSEFNKIVKSYKQNLDLEAGSEQSVILTKPEAVEEFDDICNEIKASKNFSKPLRTKINSLLEKYNLPKLPIDTRRRTVANSYIIKMFKQGINKTVEKQTDSDPMEIDDVILFEPTFQKGHQFTTKDGISFGKHKG